MTKTLKGSCSSILLCWFYVMFFAEIPGSQAQDRFHKEFKLYNQVNDFYWTTNTNLIPSGDGGYIVVGHTSGTPKAQLYLTKFDEHFNVLWNRFIGSPGLNSSSSIMRTSDGGYAICGSNSDLSATPRGIVFIKTDSLGNVELTQSLGGTGYYQAKSVRQTGDGGYIVSAHLKNGLHDPGKAWLVRLDQTANLLWTKTFDGISDVASVRQMFDGGYLLACDKYLSLAEGELCLIRTDAIGNIIWTKQYTGFGSGHIGAMIVTNDGVLLTGRLDDPFGGFAMKTDFEGNILWANRYQTIYSTSLTNIWKTGDGGFILVGGHGAMALIKIDKDGNLQWANSIWWSKNYEVHANGVVQTPDGGFLLAGYRRYEYDRALLIKTDASGMSGCRDSLFTYVPSALNPGIATASFPVGSFDSLRPIAVVVDTGGYFNTLCSSSLGFEDEDVTSRDIRIYPNPVSSILTVENNMGGELTVSIIDGSGRELSETTTSSSIVSLDVGRFAAGLYFYRISNVNGEVQTGKFLKE